MKLPLLLLSLILATNCYADNESHRTDEKQPTESTSIFSDPNRVFQCREINTLNAPVGTLCVTSKNVKYKRVLAYSGKKYYNEYENFTGETSKLYGWKVVGSPLAKTIGYVWTDPTSKAEKYWDSNHCQNLLSILFRVPSKAEYEMGSEDGIDEVLPLSGMQPFWTSDFIPDTKGYRDQPFGYRYIRENYFGKIQVKGQYSGMDANIRCLKSTPYSDVEERP